MSSNARVLRIPRLDAGNETSFILLHISSDGALALDLKLVATEGENAYVGSVRQKRLQKLRAKNYHGDEDEWERILSTTLLETTLKGADLKAADGLEVLASVTDAEEVTVSFRKNIGGITQRLGTVSLQKDETQEIELCDWTGIASEQASSTRDGLASLTARFQSQEETISKLNQQLEELIKAKEEHENAMLQKFTELLNAKKLKIRDQQRVLDGTKIDPEKAIRSSRDTVGHRVPAPSRQGKRKVASDESDNGGDIPAVDAPHARDDADVRESGEQTPSRSEDETTDGDDGPDLRDNHAPQEVAPGVGSKGKTLDASSETGVRERLSPPPERNLPFSSRTGQRQPKEQRPAQAQTGQEGSASESDDEL
ncbi:MAG: hypothetical protein M1832_006042 [Thelocarpon impressellum]|nr:MAG: hypothetical protein M1832_006042 [Thelocarpon impressellum]